MNTAELKIAPTISSSPKKGNESFFKKPGQGSLFKNGHKSASSFFNSSFIQPRLTVDASEKEADAMADKVVQRLATPEVMTKEDPFLRMKTLTSSITPLVQKKCAHCEEEEKKQKAVQRKCEACEKEEEQKLQPKSEASSSPAAHPRLEGSLNAAKGSGNPMPRALQTQMEKSFGADFSGVRLHTDSRAVQMNKDLHAQAFTYGSDIYFNAGKYDPSSASGKHLLAHELTHVVQQGAGIATKIQCLGDLSKVPPMPCVVANSSSAGTVALSPVFPTSSSGLSADQKNDIALFVLSWRASGGTDVLRVDGYASTSGSDEFNWRLSCDRALSVANELRINGVPDNMIEIFAQGETTQFGAQGNNQRAEITMIAPPPPPVITSETVVTSPGSRARTTIGVGEEVNLTHSLGSASTTWTTTAGTLSAPTGANVLFTAPDTAQRVTITADGASITFTIVAPNNVHMDNVGGAVKHHQNFPDSGILTDVFLLPDNVNFNKVTYRELDVVGIPSPGGAYSCNTFKGGHCAPAGLAPCGDKALTNTVIAGKGTKSVLGDCAYSGHCGGSPPFTPGIIIVLIPYEYKVGSGSFRRFTTVLQMHTLAADGSTLTTFKAGALGSTTVAAPTALIAVCP